MEKELKEYLAPVLRSCTFSCSTTIMTQSSQSNAPFITEDDDDLQFII